MVCVMMATVLRATPINYSNDIWQYNMHGLTAFLCFLFYLCITVIFGPLTFLNVMIKFIKVLSIL